MRRRYRYCGADLEHAVGPFGDLDLGTGLIEMVTAAQDRRQDDGAAALDVNEPVKVLHDTKSAALPYSSQTVIPQCGEAWPLS